MFVDSRKWFQADNLKFLDSIKIFDGLNQKQKDHGLIYVDLVLPDVVTKRCWKMHRYSTANWVINIGVSMVVKRPVQ